MKLQPFRILGFIVMLTLVLSAGGNPHAAQGMELGSRDNRQAVTPMVTTSTTSENLLDNPDFDQQLTNWNVSSGSAIYTADHSIYHSQYLSAKGVETSISSLGRLYQDVTTKTIPNNAYRISGWIKTDGVISGTVVIGLDYVNAGGWTPPGGFVKEIGFASGTHDWTYYESSPFTLPSMPADSVALWFLVDFNAGTGTAYWDDLALIPVDSIQSDMLDLVGQIGGSTNAVAVQGNYAYIGEGPRLKILDITNPTSPSLVGKTAVLPSVVAGVSVTGDYAYLADGEAGVRIINIANPANPSEVGFYDTPGWAYGVTVTGNYAYIADGGSGLRIIDISNPATPSQVGSYDTPGEAYGVAVAGNYAYLADLDAGLRIINISNPATPSEVGFYDTPGLAFGLAVTGNYAYVADYDAGLRIINISNPAAPSEVGFYDTPNQAFGVAVAGNYAYVADGGSGLRIINITNPAAPSEVGFYDTPGWANYVAATGNYAYVADYVTGLRIVNISDPAAPSEVGSYSCTPSQANSVAVADNYAYVADGDSGLRIINIANPAALSEVGFYDTPGLADGVALTGNYAYVADAGSGLRIIDISDPAAPSEVGFYDTPGWAESVALNGNYAYIADADYGLRIINISNPAAPSEVGFYYLPGTTAYNVAVTGNYAYVAYGDAGLRIINISNPAAPIEVGFYDTPGWAYGVGVVGNFAYVADRFSGLRIINISNPAAPSEVGFYDTPGWANNIVLAGNYAYVTDGGSGLRIINISNPATPSEVGFYYTPGTTAFGVAVTGNYAYVADSDAGLVILSREFQPNPDGYSFCNGPTSRSCGQGWGEYPGSAHDLQYDDMIRMFGQNNVCFMLGSRCVYKPSAIIWHDKVNWGMNGGHCYGMAVTSLRFYKGLDSPDDISSNANTTYGFILSQARRNISYFFSMQLTQPINSQIHRSRQSSPSDILAQVQAALVDGASDPVILIIQNGNLSHALTPYAVTDKGYGEYWIRVYDSNLPDRADKYVVVNTNNSTWEYYLEMGLGTWVGDSSSHSLGLIPLSFHDDTLVMCPFCSVTKLNSINETLYGQLWLTGQGHLLITDSDGKRIGFVGDQFVNEIPGAYENVWIGGLGVEMEPLYTIPLTETYTVLLDGQAFTQTSTASITQFGPGYAAGVDNVPIGPSTQDELTIVPDGKQLVYQSGEIKSVTINLALDSANKSERFQVQGADIGISQVMTLTVNVVDGKLVFDNSQTTGGTYDLSIVIVDNGGLSMFIHAGIVISATDTHYIDFNSWNGYDAITLEIDHGSDGSIDETLQIDNELIYIYLPIVTLK